MEEYPYNGSYNANNMHPQDQSGDDPMMMMGQGGMGGGGMMVGQSLDEIVNQNAKAMRRQSMPRQYSTHPTDTDEDERQMATMDYTGGTPGGPMDGMMYNTNTAMDQSGMMSGHATPAHPQRQHSNSRRHSRNDLALDTTFVDGSQNYRQMMPSNSAFSARARPQNPFGMMEDSYMNSPMGIQMEFGMGPGLGNSTPSQAQQMQAYHQQQVNQAMMSSPAYQNGSQTPMSARPALQDPGGGSRRQYSQNANNPASAAPVLSRSNSLQVPNMPTPSQSNHPSPNTAAAAPQVYNPQGFPRQVQNPIPGSSQDLGVGRRVETQDNGADVPVSSAKTYNPNNQGFDWEQPTGGWPGSMAGARPHMQTQYKNAYSSTGFDMLGVLMRVATRPNPEINIGSVDLSCAFVVCDAEMDDFPIVYCSDNFERLTGYTKHMILGRNCRFLQSPDGNVEAGKRRKYVDDDSILYLKNMINSRRESQISLINYRRGGQPFMNLLTMIPISWKTDQVKFFVGFQVDLVEQPNAVTDKNPDGSYSINYQRGVTMPRYVLNAPENTNKTNLGQTVPPEEVSAIISGASNGETEYVRRMWDKVLLENTDDVVHVLSLKGLFQWVSPSALQVLEYEASEIVGTALSSLCHPSDIVPVTRELKDTSTGASVNVVFRIRRKNSGYMWFEGHGSLHTEQGKGRKSIILVGRERPVYALSKKDIADAGGIGENELWTKMSTSGMFLFVSSNVRQLLDRQPEDLVGYSMQALMRAESKAEFGRILEHARTGKKASVKHELINKRGQVLSAFTTLYPGDATEGQKPTFVVAQTRLIKFSRGTSIATRPQLYPKRERISNESTPSTANSTMQDGATTQPSGEQTPTNLHDTDGSAPTYAGQNGLVVGHQDQSLASDDNLFDELKTTKSSSWQYEIRQLEKRNRILAEEVQSLIAAKKKRKRRRGKDQQKDCANCHTRVTPEWRRGPSGQRDLCNSCGLRWAKINGRVSPRTSSQQSVYSAASGKASKASQSSPLHTETAAANIKTESAGQNDLPTSGVGLDGMRQTQSPDKPFRPAEGHASQMEGARGVPDKIDEGVEP